MPHLPTLIIGAGQAGLSVSHELTRAGMEHLVLERARIGEAWRRRWDSFCLVTPNWSVQLPGHPYAGDDPDGYMPRDEIVAYLERYAAAVRAPVREGVSVRKLERAPGGGFDVHTDTEVLRAKNVVLATGAYPQPYRPAAAEGFPKDLLQIDVNNYANADALPPGRVLVVGSGQSGCQIAEELHQAGRDVVIACGRAPWGLRRIGGRDIVWWFLESGFLDAHVDSLPTPEARLFANMQATGHEGGHDLHYRTLRALGVTLVGRLAGVAGRRARFAPDLAASVAWGDERYVQIEELVKKVAEKHGMPMPDYPPPPPFDPSAPEEVDLADFGAVIFTTGFRPDYRAWLPWADAFDESGFPIQRDGASTVIDGLYFAGTHFQRKRKSSILLGVGEDAGVVAEMIAGTEGRPFSP